MDYNNMSTMRKFSCTSGLMTISNKLSELGVLGMLLWWTINTHTHLIFSFFFYWRYNPLWVLAFSVILLHSVLSSLSFLHSLIPNAWMSSSVSSTHLFLGLPPILLPVGFHSNTLLDVTYHTRAFYGPSPCSTVSMILSISYPLGPKAKKKRVVSVAILYYIPQKHTTLTTAA